MNRNIVCLLCYKPNNIWVDFLSKFTRYNVYIMVDDNTKDYKKEYSNYSNINIIQIDDEECKRNGFININFIIEKDITSWDKAVYYFSSINTEYNKLWLFEDDVFFYDEESLLSIDSKYENSDLLSRSCCEYNHTDTNNWLWDKIEIAFPPPYYNSMVCCIRISPKLLSKNREYVNEHKTLFFLEALFPTICKINDMIYDTPSEFKNIEYRKDYVDIDIDKNNLFHPVKNLSKHIYYRYMLKYSI